MGNRYLQLLIIVAYWAVTMVLMWAIYSAVGKSLPFEQTAYGSLLGVLAFMVAELKADRK